MLIFFVNKNKSRIMHLFVTDIMILSLQLITLFSSGRQKSDNNQGKNDSNSLHRPINIKILLQINKYKKVYLHTLQSTG